MNSKAIFEEAWKWQALVSDAGDQLLIEFESNKKARIHLKELLAETADIHVHEFLETVIKYLEEKALSL